MEHRRTTVVGARISARALALVCACLAAGAPAASNVWKPGVATGNWSVDANWSQGHAPTAAETVWITNTTASTGYSVAADVSYRSTATNALVVGHASGKVNTLTVKSGTTLDFERAVEAGNRWDVQVRKGGRIVMEDGSSIRRRYGNYGEYSSMTTFNHYFIRLLDGGAFEQKGGYFGITDNARQGIWVGNPSGSATSVWHMAGGVLNWNTGQMGSGNILCVDKTGRFEMSGTAVFTNALNNGGYRPVPHYMQGGVFDMAGDSRLAVVHGGKHFFGWGDTIVRERARIQSNNQPWMLLGCANEDPKGSVARLIVKDDATFIFSGDPSAFVGGRVGCNAVLDCSSTAACRFGNAWFFVGFDEGSAEAWFRGPGVVNIGGYSGLHVGADTLTGTALGTYASNWNRTTVATAAPTGTVHVLGGTLIIGGHTSQAWDYQCLSGTVIGDASRTRTDLEDPFDLRNYCGSFYVSGGNVTNEGYFVVGVGRATGLTVQSGGTVYDQCSGSVPMVIGCAGGYGRYVLSNGTLIVKNRLLVGGATTNDLVRPAWTKPSWPVTGNYPYNRHDAKGTFTVACADRTQPCTLAVSETLTLSSDGAGTFEMIGSGATVTAKNMIVSNQVSAVAGGESKVRFVADADGLSPITISQGLTITKGAKLEVDLSDYKGLCGTKIKILDCKTRVGAFAPENVTLKRCRLIQEDGDPDIYVKASWPQGLTIIFRTDGRK